MNKFATGTRVRVTDQSHEDFGRVGTAIIGNDQPGAELVLVEFDDHRKAITANRLALADQPATLPAMWQWVSDQHGPMGYFTTDDKQEVDATRPFTGGHWREVPPAEVAAFYRWAGQLAREQA